VKAAVAHDFSAALRIEDPPIPARLVFDLR
jgi:hypothetical protein